MVAVEILNANQGNEPRGNAAFKEMAIITKRCRDEIMCAHFAKASLSRVNRARKPGEKRRALNHCDVTFNVK